MAKVKYLTVPFNYDLYNRFCDKLLDYYFFVSLTFWAN